MFLRIAEYLLLLQAEARERGTPQQERERLLAQVKVTFEHGICHL